MLCHPEAVLSVKPLPVVATDGIDMTPSEKSNESVAKGTSAGLLALRRRGEGGGGRHSVAPVNVAARLSTCKIRILAPGVLKAVELVACHSSFPVATQASASMESANL